MQNDTLHRQRADGRGQLEPQALFARPDALGHDRPRPVLDHGPTRDERMWDRHPGAGRRPLERQRDDQQAFADGSSLLPERERQTVRRRPGEQQVAALQVLRHRACQQLPVRLLPPLLAVGEDRPGQELTGRQGVSEAGGEPVGPSEPHRGLFSS